MNEHRIFDFMTNIRNFFFWSFFLGGIAYVVASLVACLIFRIDFLVLTTLFTLIFLAFLVVGIIITCLSAIIYFLGTLVWEHFPFSVILCFGLAVTVFAIIYFVTVMINAPVAGDVGDTIVSAFKSIYDGIYSVIEMIVNFFKGLFVR